MENLGVVDEEELDHVCSERETALDRPFISGRLGEGDHPSSTEEREFESSESGGEASHLRF